MNRSSNLPGLLFLATFVTFAGCARQAKHQLLLSGAPADFTSIGSYTVNVTNASGTVDILTKANLKSPWVEVKRSRPRAEGEMAGPGKRPEQYSNAVFSQDSGVGTITVISTAGDVASPGEWVRIIVYVPVLGDVKVRNSGGHVLVQNAQGGLDIQNATTRLGTGNISCTSRFPAQSPVSLSTDEGTIELSIPATSRLKVDANTGAGSVRVAARNSTVMNVVEKNMSWTGIVNGGTAELTTRVGKGDINIRIGSTAE